MDQSVTRRSQPCWFRIERVGNVAINDSFMLEAAIYHLLKAHFRSENYYVNLLELFHEVIFDHGCTKPLLKARARQTTYQTEMGQLIDLITAPEDEVDLDKFSLEK
jgi:farnesyl diphosphate synthase